MYYGSLNVRDFGAVGDGVTDDTAAFLAALALVGARGGELLLPAGVYYLPGGITESTPGLVVRGLGHRYMTPGTPNTLGAVILTDVPGAWCWQHVNANPTYNEYRGVRFENVTFAGSAVTAGGLHIRQVCHSSVVNCAADGHTTGTGFLVENDPVQTAGADASWNYWQSTLAQDCLTGFDIGGAYGGDAGGTFVDCVSLKTSARGVQGTGVGMRVGITNVTILGGKHEKNATGLLVDASTGVTVHGIRGEGNGVGIDLNRAAGFSHASRIVVSYTDSSSTTAVHIGPNQYGDIIIGDTWLPVVDDGQSTLIIGKVPNSSNALQASSASLSGTVHAARFEPTVKPTISGLYEGDTLNSVIAALVALGLVTDARGQV